MIGIVGGIGPMAGADLYKRIVENTVAHKDQEHLPVLLASMPNEIPDRTEYLLGKTQENPAIAISKIILMLEKAGAGYIGIACNTAHAPQILEPMIDILRDQHSRVKIVDMIGETLEAILEHPDGIQRVGLLSTTGTFKTRIYQQRLEAAGLIPVVLDLEQHEALPQRAIYQIKAHASEIPQAPVDLINRAIALLKAQGAEAIVLGCTELGMIEHRLDTLGLEVFNPNEILARALIRHSYPSKLKVSAETLEHAVNP